VPDVQQRFLVHRLVLENREDRLTPIEQGMPRPVELLVQEHLADPAIGLFGELAHGLSFGPGGGPATSRSLGSGLRMNLWVLTRIDAAREERLELGVDTGAAECALDERVETEGGQMALVEDNRMPERDRLAVVRALRQQAEELARARTHTVIARDQRRAVDQRRHRQYGTPC